MGRGRAKAKQTKVARQLKYASSETDLAALQAELAGSGGHDDHADSQPTADDDTDQSANGADGPADEWSEDDNDD